MAVTHAGELRYRVVLLERHKHLARPSGFIESDYKPWTGLPAAGEPAKIEEGQGSESSGHASIDASVPVLVTIRYDLPRRPGPDDCVKLLDGTDRVCNIVAVRDPDGRRRWWELSCRVAG